MPLTPVGLCAVVPDGNLMAPVDVQLAFWFDPILNAVSPFV